MIGFEKKLNLLVGFPSGEQWHGGFGICLTNMFGHFMATKVPGYREQMIKPMQVKGSILSRSRAEIVKTALKDQFSHILFIDTDQTFPRDTAHRLLQHKKDVVGCNIATKQVPASPTARKKAENFHGLPVYTDTDSPPLERVWRLGTGIMLIDVRVFRKIGPGCFEIRWIEQLQDYMGEDWSMCQAIEAAGYEIWVDHLLSDEVGHLGEYKYTHDVVGSKEFHEVQERKVIGER